MYFSEDATGIFEGSRAASASRYFDIIMSRHGRSHTPAVVPEVASGVADAPSGTGEAASTMLTVAPEPCGAPPLGPPPLLPGPLFVPAPLAAG